VVFWCVAIYRLASMLTVWPGDFVLERSIGKLVVLGALMSGKQCNNGRGRNRRMTESTFVPYYRPMHHGLKLRPAQSPATSDENRNPIAGLIKERRCSADPRYTDEPNGGGMRMW
jgi:hypothetical protein